MIHTTTTAQKEALRRWLHEVDHTSFQSFAVQCEYKLRQSAAQSAQFPTPNAFGTSVAWTCLMRAAMELPHYQGLFEALAQTIGPAVYCNDNTLATQLLGDGSEDDAWVLFEAETHFDRARRMQQDISQLQGTLEKLLDATRAVKDTLTTQSMFSALGVVSETLRAASDHSVTLLARQQRRQEKGNTFAVDPADSTDPADPAHSTERKVVLEKVTDIEAAMRVMTKMENEGLHHFITDLASYRSDFVSAGVLSDLFGIASPSCRSTLLSLLWRLLHHTEKVILLSTIPLRSRDENFRDKLEVILSECGMLPQTDDITTSSSLSSSLSRSTQEELPKVMMPDHAILSVVERTCHAATVASESQNREFFVRMLCALDMIPAGEQHLNAKDIELPSDPAGTIESRARETVRRWHVEREKAEDLRDQLEEAQEKLIESKASVRTMVRVQAKLNAYDTSSSQIRSDDKGVSIHMDTSLSGGKVEWPILHHTNSPRRHSLHRLIDNYYEEEALRNGGHDSASISGGRSSSFSNGGDDMMSLEELHAAIASFYSCALLSADGRLSYLHSMADTMKLHLVCEYGEAPMAIEHCQRIDSALRVLYKVDPRCHLFAMLCGSVEASSFFSRPETSQFVVTTLAHILKAEVVEGVAGVQDLFEVTAGNRTNVFHCDRAETVVRNLFRVQADHSDQSVSEHVSNSLFIVSCSYKNCRGCCVVCSPCMCDVCMFVCCRRLTWNSFLFGLCTCVCVCLLCVCS